MNETFKHKNDYNNNGRTKNDFKIIRNILRKFKESSVAAIQKVRLMRTAQIITKIFA